MNLKKKKLVGDFDLAENLHTSKKESHIINTVIKIKKYCLVSKKKIPKD